MEIYGNVILNTGTTDGFSGHAVYVANATGIKTVEDNAGYGMLLFGLHAYAEGGGLRGLRILGNAGVDNLVGGQAPLQDILIAGNDFTKLTVGYSSDNQDVTIIGNQLSRFTLADDYQHVTFTGNTVWDGRAAVGTRRPARRRRRRLGPQPLPHDRLRLEHAQQPLAMLPQQLLGLVGGHRLGRQQHLDRQPTGQQRDDPTQPLRAGSGPGDHPRLRRSVEHRGQPLAASWPRAPATPSTTSPTTAPGRSVPARGPAAPSRSR